MPDRRAKDISLADAITALNQNLELDEVLDVFVESARALTGAKYAALHVMDPQGKSVAFHVKGMDDSTQGMIGHPPGRVGVLGRIPDHGTLAVENVRTHPAHQGMPANHPELGTFLGTALTVRDTVFGYLYLADKDGPFDDGDDHLIMALAAGASVAIDHATLYEQAKQRERWLEASQRLTTEMLTITDEEEALQGIVDAACDLAGASTAALVLPGVDDQWIIEMTAGDGSEALIGLALPAEGRAMEVVRTGTGIVAPAPPGTHVLKEVTEYGPSLYAPLSAEGKAIGLLMLWRNNGEAEFSEDDLRTAQRFAHQAALALTLTELSHARNHSALLEERERLADDLHDFVSQELFATAMQIEAISSESKPEVRARLAETLEHVKRAQHEVRGVMRALAGQRSAEPIADRARRELTLATASLGFSPDIVVAQWSPVADAVAHDSTLADDIIAVMRELLSNVARHAKASAVKFWITVEDARLEIGVEDNGIGPAGALKRYSGTNNLANRALRRHGSFALHAVNKGADMPGSVATWNVEVTS
ncbi:GAF domain-containing protein [Demequina sp. B12]|uniref:sensor histidine kinase n=1 Tax=Demequina sp. B12 TaxID=2992757 RepID=UPI00237A723B|nr:GAF domain-containing protein [Demequina sp. B12]MDE0572781.1 GAF domain-containing protein [Demequina sp. B12]